MSYHLPRINIARHLNDDDSIVNFNVIFRNRVINENENNKCFILDKTIRSINNYLHCNNCNQNYFYNEYYKNINSNCPLCRKSFIHNNYFFIYSNK